MACDRGPRMAALTQPSWHKSPRHLPRRRPISVAKRVRDFLRLSFPYHPGAVERHTVQRGSAQGAPTPEELRHAASRRLERYSDGPKPEPLSRERACQSHPTRAASMPSQRHAGAAPRAGILAREAPQASQVRQRGSALEARGDPGERGARSREGPAYQGSRQQRNQNLR
jgi:hypothetical protein